LPVNAKSRLLEFILSIARYVRQCKTRPQCAARAVLCGGVKVSRRRILFS